jgi:hypothetical protein
VSDKCPSFDEMTAAERVQAVCAAREMVEAAKSPVEKIRDQLEKAMQPFLYQPLIPSNKALMVKIIEDHVSVARADWEDSPTGQCLTVSLKAPLDYVCLTFNAAL